MNEISLFLFCFQMAAAIETKLYVTNFPSSATRQQLQQFFSRFGRVQECASKSEE